MESFCIVKWEIIKFMTGVVFYGCIVVVDISMARCFLSVPPAIKGVAPPPFPNCDWRFNEFPNPAAHALHATCIELMALPVSCQAVSGALLNIVLKG